ncbi:MAG: YafY family transcriptional regulator [Bacteroidetes bacterium]|nr:YafY family transcriptional regulator [Bacteroidota bacterium]
MNRTDRLFAILLEIQSNHGITAARLAERFDVTKRTVYRDVLALMDANVPVRGKAGSGYTIDEDYFLPPIGFTKDEALLLILGAGAVGRHFDAQYRKAARSAENKIRASLSRDLKREVAYLKSYIHFLTGPAEPNGEVADAMQKIRRAIIERKSLAFRYFKRHAESPEPMVRQVDPYALLNFTGAWAVTGYDHLRKDLRMFRLDRMEGVMVTSRTFERPKNFRLSEPAREDRSTRKQYQVRISREIYRWVKEQPPYRIVKSRMLPKHVLLTIESSSADAVITWMLRWGDQAEAVAPPEFRDQVRTMLSRLFSLYE